MSHFKQFSYKEFGYFDFASNLSVELDRQDYSGFILIVFVKAGGHAIIDFQEYDIEQDTFFFINAGQHFRFNDQCNGMVTLLRRVLPCKQGL